jgi:post-segregation antitoxin (ccd killing protein)
MMLRMKERVTISVDPEALEAARADVEAGRAPNLSAAVEKALTRQKRHQAMREYVELWEEEFGPIGEEAREWARKELEMVWGEISSSTQGR